MGGRAWSDEEKALVREMYESAPPLRTKDLAERLGRTVEAICIMGQRMGLGNWHRPKVVQRKEKKRMFDTPEERNAHTSAVRKKWIAENGHPRGALGLKHSPETRAKISSKVRAAMDRPDSRFKSEEYRQQVSDRISKMIAERGQWGGYSRAASGRRPDLGNRYFRSAWEANYARYLNLLVKQGKIAGWEYEAHTFWFEAIKRGTRSYCPDFKVIHVDRSHEWHEVKGWMDDKSRIKLERMAKYYPHERVVVIGEEWFKQAARGGLAACLPGWERKGRPKLPKQERQLGLLLSRTS